MKELGKPIKLNNEKKKIQLFNKHLFPFQEETNQKHHLSYYFMSSV
jgi:hypothetical protein